MATNELLYVVANTCRRLTLLDISHSNQVAIHLVVIHLVIIHRLVIHLVVIHLVIIHLAIHLVVHIQKILLYSSFHH